MKVLVIRFSSIGDIVLTTPIIRCLYRQSGCEIHYLTKNQYTPILRHNPYIARIHTLENTTRKELNQLGFDCIIDLHKNLRSYAFRQLKGAKVISFDKSNIRKWLLVNLKSKRLSPSKHIVDRYFSAISELNIKNDGLGLDFFLDPENKDRTHHALPIKNYYVLVLGANYFTKRIPISKCREIIASNDLHCILIGGEDTVESGNLLNHEFPERALDMTGKLNLHDSATAIKNARFVITGDTGMMHIAAAFNKKIYILWGNTVPEFGMYPYYGEKLPDRAINLEVEDLKCRPCSKLGYQKCPKTHFKCMMDQDISVIQTD